MSKRNLILTSLVAAIPAGVLLALIVMSLVGSFENMTWALRISAGLLLAMSALVVLLPLGIALEVAGLGYGRVPAGAPANVPLDDDDDDDDFEPAASSADDDDDDDLSFEDEDDDDDGFDDFDDDDDDDDWALEPVLKPNSASKRSIEFWAAKQPESVLGPPLVQSEAEPAAPVHRCIEFASRNQLKLRARLSH